jgi:hypothetical protein
MNKIFKLLKRFYFNNLRMIGSQKQMKLEVEDKKELEELKIMIKRV